MKMKEEEKYIRRIFRRINKKYPCPSPIELKFLTETESKNIDYWGLCEQYKNKFVISIANIGFSGMVYTLIHELAHAHYFDENDFHCPLWAEQYAKLWQVYAEE